MAPEAPSGTEPPLRVVLWGTYDTGKPRIRILRDGLIAAGVALEQCHVNVWQGIEDKSQIRGIGQRVGLLLRWLAAYPRLAWSLVRARRPDCVLISYPGILDVLVAFPIARLRGIPIVWDVFLSLYDTVCEDRRLLRPAGIPGRLLRFVERLALRCADLPFMDTQAHARRLETLFGLPRDSCGAVWVGAETAVFAPPTRPRPQRNAATRVLFYGQFIPLHGIPTIIEAARLLRDHPIEWQIVGTGQEAARIRRMLDEDPLPRLQWVNWVEYRKLADWIAEADVCLGIFGTTDKAASVIPNKVFQIVSAGRPLVTRDGPAIRELLSPSPGCVALVDPGNPRALADAVLALGARSEAPDQDSPACHGGLGNLIGSAAIGQQFTLMTRLRLSP